MKKYLVLALVTMFASSAYAGNVNWNGGTTLRYTKLTTKNSDGITGALQGKNDSERDTKTMDMRAYLGASGGWDNVEWGTEVRTSTDDNGAGTTFPNNSYFTVGTSSQSGTVDVAVSRAWASYGNDWGFGDIKLILGRQAPAVMSGKSQLLYDKDVGFDGFGWQWSWGSFGFNMNQYFLGAYTQSVAGDGTTTVTNTGATTISSDDREVTNPDHFQMLYSFQPYLKWRFTDEIDMKLAFAYHEYAKTKGFTNTFATANAGGISAVDSITIDMKNHRQWHALLQLGLPMSFMFEAEYINGSDHKFGTNTSKTADSDAFSLGLVYGSAKKAHDFSIGYYYHDKGVASVIERFTHDTIRTDYKGHDLWLKYALANNFNLGLELYFLEEKTKLNPATGDALATANEKVEKDYIKLTANVMF